MYDSVSNIVFGLIIFTLLPKTQYQNKELFADPGENFELFADPGENVELFADPGENVELFADPGENFELFADPGENFELFSDPGENFAAATCQAVLNKNLMTHFAPKILILLFH